MYHFLFIKRGVTQRDPLVMVVYGLRISPLIRELRKAHPVVTQTWYADDAGGGVTFKSIWRHLHYLMVIGSLRGYFPEPANIILVLSPWNVLQAEAFFQGYVLQIGTGSRYLGGFVGSKAD